MMDAILIFLSKFEGAVVAQPCMIGGGRGRRSRNQHIDWLKAIPVADPCCEKV